MIDFKDYLIQEYIRDVNGYKAVEFKFSYSLKTKCMKDCLKSTNNNIIRVYIRFVDESLKTSDFYFCNQELRSFELLKM